MARVTYGSGVTELAGSIGGVTFQKNASGNIAKLRANPVVNPTSIQAEYQLRLAYLVSYWPTLSQANKDAWGVFAAANDHTTPWGEIKTLSGYQWFLSCNLTRLTWGASILDTPPAYDATAPPDTFTIETSATYIRAAWSPDYVTTYRLFLYMSLPLRQSSLKLRRSTFLVDTDFGNSPYTNIDFTTYFETLANVTWADFYSSADCHIIIRIRAIRTSRGLSSPYASAIIKI